MTRTYIRGGTVVSASGATGADVLVDAERVDALLDPGSDLAAAAAEGAHRVVDATGRYVIPGGVDVHTHLQLPMTPESTSADTFETGTAAAAWGGTTTIIDFIGQMKGDGVRDAIEHRLAEAEGRCTVDYGFHLSMGDVNAASLKEMPAVVAEGITSFKYFMAYPGTYYSDDGQLMAAMLGAADAGGLVMMHAENGIAIDVLRDRATARGDTDPLWHARTRPARLEAEAVHRAAALADVAGAALYIVHLTSAEALEQVTWARQRGQRVFAETCPQYLYLSIEEHLARDGIDGLRYVCSPPLRSRDNHDTLWRGLRTDDLAVVSTDHCPFCDADKRFGIDDFRLTPNGLGALEHRMDLVHQGVVDGEIGLARWVDVCATTPARLFGLYPRKGVIAPGSDADIVIYDPTATHRLGVDTHHMNIDHSIWEGFVLSGGVESVLSRGRFVIDDRRYVGRPGHGRFLVRDPSEFL